MASISINQSAIYYKTFQIPVITHDTGMMHIAAAFQMKIIHGVWRNPVPDLGCAPYFPNPENKIIQVENLSCRPCQ